MLHNGLKKDAINEFLMKYYKSSPIWVKLKEHGRSFYMNIEETVILLVEKVLAYKD